MTVSLGVSVYVAWMLEPTEVTNGCEPPDTGAGAHQVLLQKHYPLFPTEQWLHLRLISSEKQFIHTIHFFPPAYLRFVLFVFFKKVKCNVICDFWWFLMLAFITIKSPLRTAPLISSSLFLCFISIWFLEHFNFSPGLWWLVHSSVMCCSVSMTELCFL